MSASPSRDPSDIEQRMLDLVENPDARRAFFGQFLASLGPEGLEDLKLILDEKSTQSPSAEMAVVNAMGARQLSATAKQALKFASLVNLFKYRQRLLETAIPATSLASMLGVSRTTIHDRFRSGQLLGVLDNNILKFPDWQFDPSGPNGLVAGLSEVMVALKVTNLAKISWLASPNLVFENERPIDVLRRGEIAEVVAEARAVGIT